MSGSEAEDSADEDDAGLADIEADAEVEAERCQDQRLHILLMKKMQGLQKNERMQQEQTMQMKWVWVQKPVSNVR